MPAFRDIPQEIDQTSTLDTHSTRSLGNTHKIRMSSKYKANLSRGKIRVISLDTLEVALDELRVYPGSLLTFRGRSIGQ